MANSEQIIEPILALTNIIDWNEDLLSEWPDNMNVLVDNNSNIILNLSSITYSIQNAEETYPSSYKIIKLSINWGDETTENYQYNINLNDPNWLTKLDEWLTKIGPHRYNFTTGDEGEKTIIIKLWDSGNYMYGLKVKLDILSKSFYTLKFELDVEKAVFNSEQASVVFKINKTDTKVPNDIDPTIPIVSILN